MVTARKLVVLMELDSSSATEKDDEEYVIDLDYDKITFDNKDFGWVIFFDGKQRVLIFTNDLYLSQCMLKVCFAQWYS